MRKLPFRAWDVVEKKMYYPQDIAGNPNIYHGSNDDGSLRISLVVGQHEHRELVVMQDTGLIDKNGKKVYEGDIIITGNFGNEPVEVIWNEETLMLGFYYKNSWGKSFVGLFRIKHDVEVVGNIYENPELLKEGGVYNKCSLSKQKCKYADKDGKCTRNECILQEFWGNMKKAKLENADWKW